MIRQEAMLKRIRIQRQEIGRLNDMIKHRDDKERKRNHRHKEMLKEGIKIERKRLKQSLAKSIKKVKKVDSKVDNPEFELGYQLACELIERELGLEDSKE